MRVNNGTLRLVGVFLGRLYQTAPDSFDLTLIPNCVDFDQPAIVTTIHSTRVMGRIDSGVLDGQYYLRRIEMEWHRYGSMDSLENFQAATINQTWSSHERRECSCRTLSKRDPTFSLFDELEFLRLARDYVLPEAQNGDMICVLGEVDYCFLLSPLPSGQFSLVGSAFRSPLSRAGLDAGPLSDLTEEAMITDLYANAFLFLI
jgi:hypothetical protein